MWALPSHSVKGSLSREGEEMNGEKSSTRLGYTVWDEKRFKKFQIILEVLGICSGTLKTL